MAFGSTLVNNYNITQCQIKVCHSPLLSLCSAVGLLQVTTPWLETEVRLWAGDQGGGGRHRVDEVKGGRRARILLEPVTSDLPFHTSTSWKKLLSCCGPLQLPIREWLYFCIYPCSLKHDWCSCFPQTAGLNYWPNASILTKHTFFVCAKIFSTQARTLKSLFLLKIKIVLLGNCVGPVGFHASNDVIPLNG